MVIAVAQGDCGSQFQTTLRRDRGRRRSQRTHRGRLFGAGRNVNPSPRTATHGGRLLRDGGNSVSRSGEIPEELWEHMPWTLYAIHAGDALVKTLLMTVILGVWRK